MINLALVYFLNWVIFGTIGAIRGWAKELLVTFSVILALFILMIGESYVPVAKTYLSQVGLAQFWLRSGIFITLVLFGYQTPYLRFFQNDNEKFRRSKVQDTLLGLVFGMINGYLIVGTLWFYLHQVGYPFDSITPPNLNQPMGELIQGLIQWLPPQWLTGPVLFISFAVFAVFILVLFI